MWLIILASSEAGFVPKPSLGPRADNVIIPLDLTQLSCPGFTLAAGLPSGFTTDGVSRWAWSPEESLQSQSILTMSHWSSGLPVCFPSQGTQVQISRGVLMWNWNSSVSVVSLQHFHIPPSLPYFDGSVSSCLPTASISIPQYLQHVKFPYHHLRHILTLPNHHIYKFSTLLWSIPPYIFNKHHICYHSSVLSVGPFSFTITSLMYS